jgi:hypothetical protein
MFEKLALQEVRHPSGYMVKGAIGGAIDPVHGAAWGQAIGGVGGGALGGYGGDALAGTTGLKNAAAFNYYSNAAQNIDLSTEPNSAVFYSGPGNRDLATSYANANGASTIEMTKGGSWLDNEQLFGKDSALTPDQADQVWRTASERYASGASGDVTAFTEGARPTGVFNTVEYPALQNNPNVNNINFLGK